MEVPFYDRYASGKAIWASKVILPLEIWRPHVNSNLDQKLEHCSQENTNWLRKPNYSPWMFLAPYRQGILALRLLNWTMSGNFNSVVEPTIMSGWYGTAVSGLWMLTIASTRPYTISVNIYGRFELQNVINLSMRHAPGDKSKHHQGLCMRILASKKLNVHAFLSIFHLSSW